MGPRNEANHSSARFLIAPDPRCCSGFTTSNDRTSGAMLDMAPLIFLARTAVTRSSISLRIWSSSIALPVLISVSLFKRMLSRFATRLQNSAGCQEHRREGGHTDKHGRANQSGVLGGAQSGDRPLLPGDPPEDAGLTRGIGLVEEDRGQKRADGFVRVTAGGQRSWRVQSLWREAREPGIDALSGLIPRGHELQEVQGLSDALDRRTAAIVPLERALVHHWLLSQQREGPLVDAEEVAHDPVQAVSSGARLDQTLLLC